MKKNGFTLVELSIVIVIIGFLVASIAAGSNLVKQAKLKSMLSDMEQYTLAVQTFNLRFNYLPGDFPAASSVWSNCHQVNASCNGNGNGRIDWSNAGIGNGTGDETIKSVRQLFLSGIYSNGGQTQPSNSYRNHSDFLRTANGVTFPSLSSDSGLRMFLNAGEPTNAIWFSIYKPFPLSDHAVFIASPTGNDGAGGFFMPGAISAIDAHNIDVKFDDGAFSGGNASGADTGIIRVANATTAPQVPLTTCKPSSNTYDITQTSKDCVLGKKAF